MGLMKVPMIQRIEKEWQEINTDDLDKLVYKIVNNYPIIMGYIQMVNDDKIHYSIMIKHSETHEWLCTVYSISLFEGYAKTLLFMYAYIKKNNLTKKEQ